MDNMKQNNLVATAQILQEHDLFAFESRTLADLLGMNKVKVSQLLSRMETAGLVQRIERGKYLLLGLSPEHVLSNPLFIGCNLVTPAYVSFWSALHSYGFTEQVPRTTFVATTRRKPDLIFHEQYFRFVKLQPAIFFGYRRELQSGLPVVIADEEKAVLDSLRFPEYAGGFAETAKALRNALERLNLATLSEYANRFNSPSLGSRLGYLLELFGVPADQVISARGPVGLDPQRPKIGTYNARWQVYINLPETELLPDEVL